MAVGTRKGARRRTVVVVVVVVKCMVVAVGGFVFFLGQERLMRVGIETGVGALVCLF